MKQKEKQGKRQREKDGLRAECVTPTNYCLTRAIQLLNRQKAKAILEIDTPSDLDKAISVISRINKKIKTLAQLL